LRIDCGLRIARRDFLSFRTGQPAVLSCERLYMRYLDSQTDGTTPQLFDQLAADLRGTAAVRLTETSWLARADLKARLDGVLDTFKAAGGRID
jgi:uncharacterized protein with beta-barrel porin domain